MGALAEAVATTGAVTGAGGGGRALVAAAAALAAARMTGKGTGSDAVTGASHLVLLVGLSSSVPACLALFAVAEGRPAAAAGASVLGEVLGDLLLPALLQARAAVGGDDNRGGVAILAAAAVPVSLISAAPVAAPGSDTDTPAGTLGVVVPEMMIVGILILFSFMCSGFGLIVPA